jgi:SAM-dependent methyltransferase
LRSAVEAFGGCWIGIEPFPLSADLIKAFADDLPFPENSFDVVIMNAVLEHIPDVSGAFREVGRTLKPDGVFVGYSAYMECFHEISYHHLSHKALEDLAQRNGLRLEKIAPSGAFGIDYHCARLIEPFYLLAGAAHPTPGDPDIHPFSTAGLGSEAILEKSDSEENEWPRSFGRGHSLSPSRNAALCSRFHVCDSKID